jgi:hypothetical protein
MLAILTGVCLPRIGLPGFFWESETRKSKSWKERKKRERGKRGMGRKKHKGEMGSMAKAPNHCE